MNARRIFCFWEPQASMTPYLKLCMRTWAVNIPDYEIVVLDYSNLDAYIKKDTYKMSALGKFDLKVQKDAILAAVLKDHGGIFMDVDTLVTKDISSIVRNLKHTEVVTFNFHLAFVAARPGSLLLTEWTKVVQDRLARLDEAENRAVPPGWDYLGNSAADDAMANMVSASLFGRAYERIQRGQASWPSLARALWRGLGAPIFAKRRGILFRTIYKKYLRNLDREKYGFIAEAKFYGRTQMRPFDQYRKFWFEEKLDVESVFHDKQRLIALHHSWTPEWYNALSEKEVLENDCLLSKTLRHILAP